MSVEVILTISALSGMIIYYWDDIRILVHLMRSSPQLKNFDINYLIDKIPFNRTPLDDLSKLLSSTLGLASKGWNYVFIGVSLALELIVFIVLKERVDSKLLIAVCVFSSLLPMLVLLCRLKILRIKASKEGEILLTEILDNYKINYYNMQQAIEITALTIKEAPGSKKLLFNLSKGLNTASSHEDIRRLLDEFEYGLGTSWASVMADNLYFALVSGIRVTAAMEDLIQTLIQARKVSEYARRENNEGVLILKYLVPLCYGLTVVGATKYFGLSIEEYLKYQFQTDVGLGWFAISLMVYGAGLFLGFFLSKTKLDL